MLENEDIIKRKYTNQSLLRGLTIMEQFFKSSDTLGISDLSRLTGLHKSTVHRLVTTLEECRWLRRTKGDRFQIGIKPVILGHKGGDQVSSLSITHEYLTQLRDHLQETTVLTMMINDETTCVDKASSHQRLSCTSEIGRIYPCHAGATGFAVLLGMDEEEARAHLERHELVRYTERTVTDIERLMERYRLEKARGYSLASGQVDPGITGIAMPIWFPAENTYGSLGVVLPDYRSSQKRISEIVDEMNKTRLKIEKAITPGLTSLGEI